MKPPRMLRLSMVRWWVYCVQKDKSKLQRDSVNLKMHKVVTQVPSLDLSPLVVMLVLLLVLFFSAGFPFLFSTDKVRLKVDVLKLNPRFFSGIGSSLSMVTGSSFLILQKRAAQLN